jgi:glycosyltransferase involved in cell wall biosynthesis
MDGRAPPGGAATVLKDRSVGAIGRLIEIRHWSSGRPLPTLAASTQTREMQMAPISVLIATHDRPLDLRRAIASVFGQTLLPAELVVVDDGSTPPVSLEGLAVPEGLALRLIRNAQPSGPARARNTGIAAARGAWIAFLDDDDEFRPDKIATVAGALDRMEGSADLLYHPAEIVMVNEGVRYTSRPRTAGTARGMYRELLVRNIVGGTPMVVARKASVQALGGFDASLGALEDYELWLRLARHGARFCLLPQALTRCHYTTAKASVSKSAAAGLDTFSRIARKYREDLDALPPAARAAHREWILEIVLFRAILKLERFEVMKLSLALLLRFRRLKHAAVAAASLLGPRTIIRLRARFGS